MERAERQNIANAIWLCQTCAKVVDDDPHRYNVDTLLSWREDTESLANWEKGRSLDKRHAVRFAAIQIDAACLWQPAHRLHKVRTANGGHADFGFHQIPKSTWSELHVSPQTHSLDPTLDFTIVNDGELATIISAIGFEPVRVWTALKGIPIAYKVPVLDSYSLSVQKVIPGHSQMLELPDPIAVPSTEACRLKLCLAGYRKMLGGNESLIRIRLTANSVEWKSRLIYMGAY